MRRLLGELWVISGERLTHPWDASAYLVDGDEPTLIDCGSSEGYPAMKRALRSFGYRPRDIKKVIATHGHWDHLSGMAKLRAESDARLYIHERDRKQVETGDYDRTAAFLYEKPFPPVKVDGLLRDGDLLQLGSFEFTVFHTPGHSPGSVCLWTHAYGMNLLIAGDTIAGGYHQRMRSDLGVWTDSLDRLLQLEFDVMTIGHCPPVLIFDAKQRVRDMRQRFGAILNPWFELGSAS